jgi:hypothetical protein
MVWPRVVGWVVVVVRHVERQSHVLKEDRGKNVVITLDDFLNVPRTLTKRKMWYALRTK